MYLRTVSVIFIVLTVLVSLIKSNDTSAGKFFVVSTTENPSDCHAQNNHFNQELRDALRVLNDSITHSLQQMEQKIINETENKLKRMKQEIVDSMEVTTVQTPRDCKEDTLRVLNDSITHSLHQMEQKIINETENKLKRMKQEIVDSMEVITVQTPRDCKEVQSKGYQDSGVYRIQPYLSNDEFPVYCDMSTRGGGWTYVLSRFDGSQDFYLNWENYKKGFGKPPGEYWIGLDHLYYLTNSKANDLLFELIDWESKKVYAHYSKFKIGSDSTGYKLIELGAYTGDAGDSFTGHLGQKFTTKDHDQDINPGNCAQIYPGAWWFSNCFTSHPAGKYIKNSNPIPFASGVIWYHFRGHNYSLKEVRMMIRPLSTS